MLKRKQFSEVLLLVFAALLIAALCCRYKRTQTPTPRPMPTPHATPTPVRAKAVPSPSATPQARMPALRAARSVIKQSLMAAEPERNIYFGGEDVIVSTDGDGMAIHYSVPAGFMAMRDARTVECQGRPQGFLRCSEGEYVVTRCLKPVVGNGVASRLYGRTFGPDETCDYERAVLHQ